MISSSTRARIRTGTGSPPADFESVGGVGKNTFKAKFSVPCFPWVPCFPEPRGGFWALSGSAPPPSDFATRGAA